VETPIKPLDEALWQAWVAKGREQDRRSSAARMNAVKCISAVTLLAAATLWFRITRWRRAFVFASAVPFVACSRNMRQAQ